MTENQQQQLSALLRLKRFEQPPAGYFEKLLQDVHRRQRAELLRRPLWKIALERIHTFFGEHSMGQLSYSGAMVALAIVGITVIGVAIPGRKAADNPAALVADARPIDLRADQPVAARILSLQHAPVMMTASTEVDPIGNARLLPSNSVRDVSGRTPRYVIDSRPVTIPASFNF